MMDELPTHSHILIKGRLLSGTEAIPKTTNKGMRHFTLSQHGLNSPTATCGADDNENLLIRACGSLRELVLVSRDVVSKPPPTIAAILAEAKVETGRESPDDIRGPKFRMIITEVNEDALMLFTSIIHSNAPKLVTANRRYDLACGLDTVVAILRCSSP